MLHISIKAEELFSINGFPISNSLILTAIIFVLFLVGALYLNRRLALVPGKIQNVAEVVVEGALGIMDSVLPGRKFSEKYLPIVATIFLLILFSNWFGLIPGIGSVVFYGEHETAPLFRAPSSDLNFTLAVALTTVIAINLFGIMAIGLKAHAKKYFNFKNPIAFFIGIIELISEIAKIISFSFRLFGNIFAGEVLLLVVAFLVPYLVPLPFFFLEVFVGFIQALVFAMLALVFIAMATVETEHH